MEFVPIFEFCASPKEISARLKEEGRIVITDNGRPTAIMLGVDDSSFEETLADLRRLQAKRSLKDLQTASVKNGVSRMTMEEIDAEIAAARADRMSRETTR
jgi:PHD/YefM family antitoxin component YafN of YafNO toxin-antitoxin module